MNIYVYNQQQQLCYSTDFFQHSLSKALNDPNLKIISAQLDESAYDTETAHTKYAQENKRILGLFHYHISYQTQGKIQEASILVKSKRSSSEFINLISSILIKAGVELDPETLSALLVQTAKNDTDIKEIEIYQLALKDPALAYFLPKVYGTYEDAIQQQYIILEEYLSDAYLMQDYLDHSYWDKNNIINTLENLSRFHALYYQRYQSLTQQTHIGENISTTTMVKLMPLWQALAKNLANYTNVLFTPEAYQRHLEIVDSIPQWFPKIDAMPKTLIYNDLQIRNLAVRQDKRLCLFDWEVATIHIPQRDVIEFLCYAMHDNMTDSDLSEFIEISRHSLSEATQQAIDSHNWLEGCLYALYEYQIDRLALQLCLHKIIHRPDIERVFWASQRLLKFLQNYL